MDKLEVSQKMLGQTVYVIGKHKTWEGIVQEVVDEYNFLVKNIKKGNIENVSMFDIRQKFD